MKTFSSYLALPCNRGKDNLSPGLIHYSWISNETPAETASLQQLGQGLLPGEDPCETRGSFHTVLSAQLLATAAPEAEFTLKVLEVNSALGASKEERGKN